ncbi:MAG: hypothetical protein KDA96_09005 [Planctomycetaceae bacterium]|nr:hypothetical protein [Planctomycetaceae bacterium]
MEKQAEFQRVITISFATVAIAGCAGLTVPGTDFTRSQGSGPQNSMETLQEIEREFLVIDPAASQIDVEDLKVSQQVRLFASVCSREEMVNGGSLEVIEYVGTIESIDDSQIVLKDACLVTDVTADTSPIAGKVPYANRLFTNTSYAKKTHPLPHAVIIPRSTVILAQQPSEPAGAERLGIDFDINTEGNPAK